MAAEEDMLLEFRAIVGAGDEDRASVWCAEKYGKVNKSQSPSPTAAKLAITSALTSSPSQSRA
jgi:hypothetical protein